VSSIVRDCPFFDRPTYVEVAGEHIDILPFQIVVWVSLQVGDKMTPRFPAILDTGNSFSFSVREEQLNRWAQIDVNSLPRAGTIEINKRKHAVLEAGLALYRNKRGQRDEVSGTTLLDLPRGFAVYAVGDALAPRLPLLGLRTLVHNRLTTKIDGRRLLISISSPLF